jgi:hypothetical protein
MKKNLIDRLGHIRKFYDKHKIMPTYDEICEIFGFKSKNAAFKLVNKFVAQGFIKKWIKVA